MFKTSGFPHNFLKILVEKNVQTKYLNDAILMKYPGYRRGVGKMKTWIEQECQKVGVAAEVMICTELKSTGDLILQNITKKKVNLVVVGAKVGPFAALIGGSVTRQIVRGSQVPVLVLK